MYMRGEGLRKEWLRLAEFPMERKNYEFLANPKKFNPRVQWILSEENFLNQKSILLGMTLKKAFDAKEMFFKQLENMKIKNEVGQLITKQNFKIEDARFIKRKNRTR